MAAWLSALSPAWAMAVNVLTTIALSRIRPQRSLLWTLYAACACGGAALLALRAPRWPGTGEVLADLLIYGALSYGFFHFINLGETARRIRILRELHEAEAGLSEGELLSRYDAAAIRSARLDRLLRSRQIVDKDGRYRIGSPVLLYGAEFIVFLKLFLLGRAHTDVS